MKNEQILGNNGFTEGFKPRLVRRTLSGQNHLHWIFQVSVSICHPDSDETIKCGELDEDEYIPTKVISKLCKGLKGDKYTVRQVLITSMMCLIIVEDEEEFVRELIN